MGLLAEGNLLEWEEGKHYAHHVRDHGITQFLKIWDNARHRDGDCLRWGDEIESMVVTFDHANKSAMLALCQPEGLKRLKNKVSRLQEENPSEADQVPTFHPEYGSYMIESTPGSPYGGCISDLLLVEANMRTRRELTGANLESHQVPITLTSFPRLGVQGAFTDPYIDPADAPFSHSLFLSDAITNPHVRYPAITSNIRQRRGSKVAINLPIYQDVKTPRPFVDPTIPHDRNLYPEDVGAQEGAALQDHIYLDALGFGAGCCCL